MTAMLEISGLRAEAGGREILKGVDLVVDEGETCVLFGPNGSGKSTLMATIMGYSSVEVTSGRIVYKGGDITGRPVDERAKLGIGMMMQRPPNIYGVKLGDLIMASAPECGNEVIGEAGDFKMDGFLDREVNVGFSGGEIKRSELLQLTAQRPELILLDEPESGVDLESIDLIGEKVRNLLDRGADGSRKVSSLVITHTGQILDYIDADKAYVMRDGAISGSGDPREMLRDIRKNGYGERRHG